MRLLQALLSIASITSPAGAQSVDLHQINRITDQAFNHSEVMQTAEYLTDRIGGRLTNSPQMRQAEKWTQQRFRDWGLRNVRAEAFAFGRGWSINRCSAWLVSPRVIELRAIPIAWTPPTNGIISAGIVVAPMSAERDFAPWRGQLRGKIVLVSSPNGGSEPSKAPYARWTDEELARFATFRQPSYSPVMIEQLKKEVDFDEKRDAFLKSEGALAWVRMARNDAGLLYGDGYGYLIGRTPLLPGSELAAEDYRRLARLAKTDTPPTLELNNDVRFHDDDINAYNIFADIPGTDKGASYVMAGAHLDSWAAADGATDNGAGSAIVMEAARIIASLAIRPKRTIRFALWAGEEQYMVGPLAYVEAHFADLTPFSLPYIVDPKGLRTHRWPILPKAGHADLLAYFNMDNGSGKIRGIGTGDNLALTPIFREWLAPFAALGASTVAPRPAYFSDHNLIVEAGIPGFHFLQDELDYDTRTAHSSLDSYDHLKADDLRQAAAILASFLLNAANRDEPLPRMPIPTEPTPSDPFDYAAPG